MPEGLEIDRKANMNGVMASYAEHVLICTGKEDWTSRIDDDDSGDNLAADLKELIGRGGDYSDVSIEFRVPRPLRKLFEVLSRCTPGRHA